MTKFAIGLLFAGLQTAAAQATPPPAAGLIDHALSFLEPADPTPQTHRERLHDYIVGAIGPVSILNEALGAGLGQWEDSPHEWGQGASGYGKRLANNLAYNGIRTSLTYGASSLFHEDNRYFASHRPSVMGRAFDALTSPAMATRAGHRTVSLSNLGSLVGTSAISLAWAPPSWQGGDNLAINVGLSYAGMAGVNLVREFLPKYIRRLRK